jgi:hypothetical protein
MNGPRVRRFVLVILLALTVGGVAAVSARADAPDVKVSSPAPGQHPTQTGVATVDTASGHVTVDLTGGWSWPTHGSDCNTNRAGAGVAVNWLDPQDRGFHVAYFDIATGVLSNTGTPGAANDFGVGSTNATGLNSVDDVVHPTENDTGATVSVSKKASSGTTRTLTATNSFVAGDSITVSINDSNYDGTFTILSRTVTTVCYTAVSVLS